MKEELSVRQDNGEEVTIILRNGATDSENMQEKQKGVNSTLLQIYFENVGTNKTS